jgi:hypothetical protein
MEDLMEVFPLNLLEKTLHDNELSGCAVDAADKKELRLHSTTSGRGFYLIRDVPVERSPHWSGKTDLHAGGFELFQVEIHGRGSSRGK